ncbi:hypothetical protein ACFQH8_17020 [Halomicroarcula sp. GCM10025710]
MRGNMISSGGMLLAVGVTVLWLDILSPIVLLAGLVVGGAVGTGLAVSVERTEMPCSSACSTASAAGPRRWSPAPSWSTSSIPRGRSPPSRSTSPPPGPSRASSAP